MKIKTISVIALFAGSAALIGGFVLKTLIDWKSYSHSITSAPFSVWILMNALYFVVPAVILSATALFVLRKTRVLLICVGMFAVMAVVSAMLSGNFLDGWIFEVPAVLSALICGIFAIISGKLLTRA